MSLHIRSQFLAAAAAASLALAMVSLPSNVHAQDYPSKEIHVICAFPAGSGADILVRHFANELGKLVSKPVIVENKPGAAGNIAAEHVVRSTPDGHTIYMHTGSATAANMHLLKNPPFDAAKAFQVAATINKQAFMVMVPTNSPYKNLRELTAAMKEKGEKASWAQSNTSGKVIGTLYNQAMGLKANEVSFRSAADSLNEFASGALDYGVIDPQFGLSQVRAGRLRALAVSSPERIKALPDVPTMAEQGIPNVKMTNWFAVLVPAATPKPIVTKINELMKTILSTAESEKFINQYGGDPYISTPEEGQALLEQQIKEWGEFVRAANIPQQ
jgi:tripartite-type tricarboxylate transporter receptor subunit TctC